MIPWRIFFLLGTFSLFVAFAALNVKNFSDISFGFLVIKEVPIFVSLFSAFSLGTIFIIPFFLKKRMKKADIFPNQKKVSAKEKTPIEEN